MQGHFFQNSILVVASTHLPEVSDDLCCRRVPPLRCGAIVGSRQLRHNPVRKSLTIGCCSSAVPAIWLMPRQDTGARMPKKGITGHDGWVVTEALATALVALEQLPPKHQPRTHMDEIRKLLAAGSLPETVNLHLAQAKCRLFPDLDREAIYREYGIGDGLG